MSERVVIIIEELNRRLMEVNLKRRERDKLKSALEKDRGELEERTEKLKELSDVLKKENQDVEKLESLSLTGLFYTILGSKDEQLDKEKQEYLAVKLRFDEAQKVISELEAEISGLVRSLAVYDGIDEQYERIMKEKECYILEHNYENSSNLAGLIEELTRLKSSEKELGEAIQAGNLVKRKLDTMIASLNSASNWGKWDMLGGGFLATAVKHSRIDEAQYHASEVQQLLRKFRYELEDVGTYIDLNVNVGSFETFMDYFFDGLISDWIVQSRINDSLNSSLRMYENISSIMTELQLKYEEVQKKNLGIEKEKTDMLKNIK